MKSIYALISFVILGLVSSPLYAKNEGNVPQGVQMKADSGQALPPGWQKKLAKGNKMDSTVYSHAKVIVPVDSRGIITIRVEDKTVRLYKATREIVDILD